MTTAASGHSKRLQCAWQLCRASHAIRHVFPYLLLSCPIEAYSVSQKVLALLVAAPRGCDAGCSSVAFLLARHSPPNVAPPCSSYPGSCPLSIPQIPSGLESPVMGITQL